MAIKKSVSQWTDEWYRREEAIKKMRGGIVRGYDRRYDVQFYSHERAAIEAHDAWMMTMQASQDVEARALVQPVAKSKLAPTSITSPRSPSLGGLNGPRLAPVVSAGTPLPATRSPSPESPAVPYWAGAQVG